jgi:hypothetical protein
VHVSGNDIGVGTGTHDRKLTKFRVLLDEEACVAFSEFRKCHVTPSAGRVRCTRSQSEVGCLMLSITMLTQERKAISNVSNNRDT